MKTYEILVVLNAEQDIDRFRQTQIYSETKEYAEMAIKEVKELGFPSSIRTACDFGLLFALSEITDMLDHGLEIVLHKSEES